VKVVQFGSARCPFSVALPQIACPHAFGIN